MPSWPGSRPARVRRHIEAGMAHARLVLGGPQQPDGLPDGFYVQPTVFAGVANDTPLAQEEIFGPVLVIIAYDGDHDAVRIANESSYGLAGGVWSADESRALAVARQVRTGQVDLNGATFNPAAPFGGYRHSGYGREFGRLGVEEFTEVKAIQR